MAQIRETHTVVEDNVPVERRTVVEEDYPPVVYERRGLSGGAIAALVIAGIAIAVLITLLILNSQQRDQQAQIDDARARADAAQRAAASQPQQPLPAQPAPPVVVMPPSSPTTVTVPAPATTPSAPTPSASSSSSTSGVTIEVDVTTKLLDDPDLRTHPIDVKVNNGVATLSGDLPSADLKAKAERIAATVKGVRHVVNKITVSGQS